jgi:hypothetical protein
MPPVTKFAPTHKFFWVRHCRHTVADAHANMYVGQSGNARSSFQIRRTLCEPSYGHGVGVHCCTARSSPCEEVSDPNRRIETQPAMDRPGRHRPRAPRFLNCPSVPSRTQGREKIWAIRRRFLAGECQLGAHTTISSS